MGLPSIGDLMNGLPILHAGPLDDTSSFVFFREVNHFLRGEIDEFGDNLLGRMMTWVGGIATTLFTLWIMIQGYRITTGQSRESMVAMATHSVRSVLIIGAATGMAFGGTTLHEFLTDRMNKEITQVVTGKEGDVYESIDRSLGYMQLAFSSIDAIQTGNSEELRDTKKRNMMFVAAGTGGPALVAGSMLLLNKIAMALVLGFGPLFIMTLLFERTKSLFDKWLLYGIGTMFSLAVLSVMSAIAMDVVSAVAATFWVGNWTGANPEGVNSLAMQQGGLGLILTTMLISTPPIAASFFQGTLGQFTPGSVFGGGYRASMGQPSRPGQMGQPGYPEYRPPVDAERPSSTQRGVDGFGSKIMRQGERSSSSRADIVKRS